MLEQITFNNFFMNTKFKMTPELYIQLNPDFMFFFKSGEVFLAFMPEGQTLHLAMAVGSGLFGQLHEIYNLMKRLNFRYLKFVTSMNNKTVHRLADYGDAKNTEMAKDFYGPGNDGLVYIFDIQDQTRFK